MKRLVPCLLAIVLCGCAAPFQPQILTFNYRIVDYVDSHTANLAIDDIVNSNLPVARLLRSSPCNFTASFSRGSDLNNPRAIPTSTVTGMPGATGFTLSIAGVRPESVTTTNPAGCLEVNELSMLIGNTSLALAVGQQTSSIDARVTFNDETAVVSFAHPSFMQARVTSFDSASRYAAGEFSFVRRVDPGSKTVLFVDGSFAMR